MPVADRRWIDLISSHPDASIFHHPAWAELLGECYGYRPSLFAICDTSGPILAGLPLAEITSRFTGRRAVALPFSDFCPPLATEDAVLSELVAGLQAWRRQQGWSQIWLHWPLPEQVGVHPAETVARHVTSLTPDPEEVFRRFKKASPRPVLGQEQTGPAGVTHDSFFSQVPQRIRQAERAGVTIRWGDAWNDLQLFYGLHLETRRRLGTPVQPLRFFRLLWERLLSRGLGFVLLAHKDTELLAGAVFLHWGRTLVYKYGASDPAHWRLRPNNLLFWHAIRWGCEHGYRSFDWGKTELENEGLRNFKRGWGTEEYLLHYSILADQPPAAAGTGLSRRLLATVIQRSPPWVCRALGELLYGHFA